MYALYLLLGSLFLLFGLVAVVIQIVGIGLLLLLLAVLFLWCASRVRTRKKAEAMAQAGQALQQNLDRFRSGNGLQEVCIPCKAKLPMLLLITLMLWPSLPDWLEAPSLGLGLFVFCLAALELVLAYRLLVEAGDSELRLSEAGISGCGWGMIPWKSVDAVGLIDSNHKYRGMDNYVTAMVFVIRDVPPLLSQMHWLRRLYLRMRNVVRAKANFHIQRCVPPELLKELARELWTRKTGLTHDYWPDQSAAINQSLRESDALRRKIQAHHKAEIDTLNEISRLADSNEEAAETLLHKLKSQDPSIARKLNETWLENAAKRQRLLLKQSQWMLLGLIGVLGMLALAAAISR